MNSKDTSLIGLHRNCNKTENIQKKSTNIQKRYPTISEYRQEIPSIPSAKILLARSWSLEFGTWLRNHQSVRPELLSPRQCGTLDLWPMDAYRMPMVSRCNPWNILDPSGPKPFIRQDAAFCIHDDAKAGCCRLSVYIAKLSVAGRIGRGKSINA